MNGTSARWAAPLIPLGGSKGTGLHRTEHCEWENASVATAPTQEDQVVERSTLMGLDGITIRFGGIVAVNNVSLNIPNRGCIGLIGPNGAGKTTLMDSISGLRTPSSGKVTLNGHDVTSRSAAWLARHGVARTFQRHQAFGWLSVAENILVPLEWHTRGWGLFGDLVASPGRRKQTKQLMEKVDAVIERCGLQSVRNEVAASLPIGQLRLLEFARAIVDRPELLLLDEPTSGLGRHETELLGQIVRQVMADDGTSVVLVEHDIDFVMGISDRIVCLEQGTLLADGTPEEVRQNPAVIAAYLGTDH
jgi:branched-chain amino acid transport system ATP-binding protein